MYTVLKRDGKISDFDLQKISKAISLAFDAQEREYNQNIIDFLQRGCGFCQFTGLQHHQALTGGQVHGVNDPDIGEIFRGDAGILVAGGEAGADGDMQHAVVVGSILAEPIFIFAHGVGGSGAQITAGGKFIIVANNNGSEIFIFEVKEMKNEKL